MAEVWDALERRVLGVLVEKSMTQPEYYPMTVNAVVAGCNQKSNRDPVMDLDDVAVEATLERLRQKGLVEHILPAPGGRTSRYRHRIETRFGWGPRERAVLTELLLRGPQTVGELRTRAGRMAGFDSLEIVMNVLSHLGEADPPAVAALPREPGQSTIRYAHRFYPPDEDLTAGAIASPTAAAPSAGLSPPASRAAPHPSDELSQKVELLQGEVKQLRQELNDLKRQLGLPTDNA